MSFVSVQPRWIPKVPLPKVLLQLPSKPFVCRLISIFQKTFNEIHLSRYQTSTTTRRPALASLTSVYADKCGIRSSGYRPDQVPMMAMGRIIKLVCYFLFFDGSHFLPASTPGSDHCAGLTELWSNSASCWFLPMAGQSLS